MLRKIIVTLFASLGCIVAITSGAFCQIITAPDVDEVCHSAPSLTSRSTLIYVDLSSIKVGEHEWGNTILHKLEFAPRERLAVLGVNPGTFDISEVFDSCWPTLTKSEIDSVQKNRGWWKKLTEMDSESQQRENLQTFNARLGNALDKLVVEAGKITVGHRRDILGAIAVDKNRFKDRAAYYRLIVFTNGVILDDFGTGADEARIAEFLSKKYPAAFSGAEVFLFGITGSDREAPLESKQRIFSNFFLSNGAHVQSFSQSLPQQTNELYSPVISMSGTFEGGGTTGSVKLTIVEAKSATAEIWLNFVVGGTALYVPFQGEYRCDKDVCSLKASATDNIPLLAAAPYFRKGDQISLSGKRGVGLEGSLGSESKEVFQGGRDEAKYKLKVILQ
jgi:hypothetical protein